MKTITIKVFSACEAVRFFNKVNPFMFLGDDDYPSQFRRHPEWYFMDPVTGAPREVRVKIPDECGISQDLGDIFRHIPSDPSTWRRGRAEPPYLECQGVSLAIEYAIVDGARMPQENDCNCPLDTNITSMV